MLIKQLRSGKEGTRFLTVSIILFLVLDAAMLWLNFTITRNVAVDALTINLAGRQRMLSQRMTKTFLMIDFSNIGNASSQRFLGEFLQAHQLFSQTIRGFERGGEVLNAELQTVPIEAIRLPEVVEDLGQARALLDPINLLVSELAKENYAPGVVDELGSLLTRDNDELLRLMNNITVAIEKSSLQKTSSLRFVQLVTFVLAILNFIYIIKLFRDRSRQSDQLLETLDNLFQGTQAGLLVFDQNDNLLSCNRAAASLFGLGVIKEGELPYTKLFAREQGVTQAINLSTGANTDVELHERFLNKDGDRLRVITAVDISHHVELQKTLSQEARRDPLTGLYNRTALNQTLNRKIEDQREPKGRFALFFVDLDEFKQINDSLGHDVGDEMLVEFARRLTRALRESDGAFRYGGDEFVLVIDLPNEDKPIEKVAEKLQEMPKDPIYIGERALEIKMSIGISVYPDDGDDGQSLLNAADKRMYRAKRSRLAAIVRS